MIRPIRTQSALLLDVFAPEPRARARAVSAIGAAILAHGALVLVVPDRSIQPPRADPPPTQIEVIPEPPPTPEPPPPPVPPPPAPVTTPPSAPTRTVQPRPAAPAPARAAAVLTQNEDPAAPADFTDSIVVGTGDTYAGGATSATGTTQRTVEVASKTPAATGTGTTPAAPPGPDRTRRARLAGGASWDCDFPAEADQAQIDHAVVTLRIAVSALGGADSVEIVTDPGNGFGRAARACALAKRYEPAMDRAGQPVPGTSLINVRFDR